jgi:hypothetical protein
MSNKLLNKLAQIIVRRDEREKIKGNKDHEGMLKL